MYFIIARYESDAERKRIEYALDKWKERLHIAKTEGIVSIINSEEIAEFLEDLYSRTSKSNVRVYRVEEREVPIEKSEKEIRLRLVEKRETVEKVVSFVMAKQKAILKRETKEPFERVYEVGTRKGRADISVSLRNDGQAIDLRVRITGYGEVVELLNNRLNEELSYLGGK